MQVLDAGIHRLVDVAGYYTDPAPEPSLTQSIAKILLSRSPQHAWFAHPRLNENRIPENPTKFDLANMAHALLLGRGRGITVIEAEDWRTKAAREQRDQVLRAGGLPVLPKVYARAKEMVEVARYTIGLAGIQWGDDADSEVCIVWHEDVRDGRGKRKVWFRSLIDRMTPSGVLDYKTTEVSASPEAISHRLVHDGWDIQAAMHERGLRILAPDLLRDSPRFLVQETDPPYACCLARLAESALTMGGVKLQQAAELWAQCTRRKRWPGYGDNHEVLLSYPDWAIRDFEYTSAVRSLEVTAEAMNDA